MFVFWCFFACLLGFPAFHKPAIGVAYQSWLKLSQMKTIHTTEEDSTGCGTESTMLSSWPVVGCETCRESADVWRGLCGKGKRWDKDGQGLDFWIGNGWSRMEKELFDDWLLTINYWWLDPIYFAVWVVFFFLSSILVLTCPGRRFPLVELFSWVIFVQAKEPHAYPPCTTGATSQCSGLIPQ